MTIQAKPSSLVVGLTMGLVFLASDGASLEGQESSARGQVRREPVGNVVRERSQEERASPGLPSPGITAEIFLPGVVSGSAEEYGLAVDSDWTEVYFTRLDGAESFVMTSRRTGRLWSEAVPASFSGVHNDSHPALVRGGSRLYFMSLRPIPGVSHSANLWIAERSGEGWGEARSAGPPVTNQTTHAPAVAEDGTLYVTGIRKHRVDGEGHRPAERLRPDITGSHPAISGDQSYLVFSARRPGGFGGKDLHVTFAKPDGTWTDPVNLGAEVNSEYGESSPTISNDGRFLFFSRRDDIWWVSTRVIIGLSTS